MLLLGQRRGTRCTVVQILILIGIYHVFSSDLYILLSIFLYFLGLTLTFVHSVVSTFSHQLYRQKFKKLNPQPHTNYNSHHTTLSTLVWNLVCQVPCLADCYRYSGLSLTFDSLVAMIFSPVANYLPCFFFSSELCQLQAPLSTTQPQHHGPIKNTQLQQLLWITALIVSITKFSIVIGSPCAYLSRNRRTITWVSNYRCPI